MDRDAQNKIKAVFLRAEWRKLLMINYELDPAILRPLLPHRTELDLFEGRCLVSMVGFMFLHTRLKGIPVPFHQRFEEVNLRFYVRYREKDIWKRGAVFIREFVPKPMITLVARTLYGEPYSTRKMKHSRETDSDFIRVEYAWKSGRWNSMSIRSENRLCEVLPGSETEFISEHYWGYTKRGAEASAEYGVEHPRWQVYPTLDFEADIDFVQNYGSEYAGLNRTKPSSAFLLEGSPVLVRDGRLLA